MGCKITPAHSARRGILRRVEEHLEDWRSRDTARHAEAHAFRDMLRAEAAERERLLAEAIGEEEARCESIEELTKQHRVVFVLHREEVSETLEDFTSQGDRARERRPDRLSIYQWCSADTSSGQDKGIGDPDWMILRRLVLSTPIGQS